MPRNLLRDEEVLSEMKFVWLSGNAEWIPDAGL